MGELQKRIDRLCKDRHEIAIPIELGEVLDVVEEMKKEFPHWKNYIGKKDGLEQYQSDTWLWFVRWLKNK